MSAYRPQSDDTSLEADRRVFERLRRMKPSERLHRALQLTQMSRELAAAGLRRRHPTADAGEVRLRLAALWLDRDTMVRVFGWDPRARGY